MYLKKKKIIDRKKNEKIDWFLAATCQNRQPIRQQIRTRRLQKDKAQCDIGTNDTRNCMKKKKSVFGSVVDELLFPRHVLRTNAFVACERASRGIWEKRNGARRREKEGERREVRRRRRRYKTDDRLSPIFMNRSPGWFPRAWIVMHGCR